MPAPLAEPVTAWALVSPQGKIIIASIGERLGQVLAYCDRWLPQRIRALVTGYTAARVRITDTRKARDEDQTDGALKPLLKGAAHA